MNILLFGKNGHVARAIAAAASAGGHQCLPVTSSACDGRDMALDMTDLGAVGRFALPAGVVFDGVVFAQGINPSKGADDISAEEFERMLRVNVVAPTLLMRKIRPHLRPGGAVVMLGSAATRRGSFDPSYGAAKSALEGLMNSLCRYDTAHRYLIVSMALVEGSPVSASMPESRREQHASAMFGGKLIGVADVAAMVLEAIRNQSLNRTTLCVEGGMWA